MIEASLLLLLSRKFFRLIFFSREKVLKFRNFFFLSFKFNREVLCRNLESSFVLFFPIKKTMNFLIFAYIFGIENFKFDQKEQK